MAAFGIMAALHEARRSGEGQLVDVSMADGALSWLAMVAGAYLCDGEVPKRGDGQLTGRFVCYLPYEAADGYITMGALEPQFWARFCAGVGREDLVAKQFERTGSEAWAEIAEIFRSRTRAEWKAFNDEHDAMIEPVLDLDEALDSELVREREMVVEWEQPELGPVRQLGVPVKLSRTPGDRARAGAGARRAHRARCSRAAGFADERDRRAARVRRRGRAAPRSRPTARFMAMSAPADQELLKISELAERADVPVATVRHYLREGLLPEPVKTSRNMAYYPPEFVERIRLIKQLQEERFMPLRVIRELLERGDGDPSGCGRCSSSRTGSSTGRSAGERERTPADEVERRYEIPREVLERLAEVGVLTPNDDGYSPTDVRIIEAIARFRAGGWNESHRLHRLRRRSR